MKLGGLVDLLHELMDRAAVQHESWEMFIQQHPAAEQVPELKALAAEVEAKMGAFYQKCGEHFDRALDAVDTES